MTNTQAVPFVIGPMTLDDIPDVMSIEKTAFPLPWPEQAYRHELLENKNGYFIVVRLKQLTGGQAELSGSGALGNAAQKQSLRLSPQVRSVIGYAGLWMFVDEAHVSTIASHVEWRGRGVGELLFVTLLREAQRRHAAFATLEVRVSNLVAQNLYTKYGFVEVGRRKHYYRDNNEDALIMTAESFRQKDYQDRLAELEQALFDRLAKGSQK